MKNKNNKKIIFVEPAGTEANVFMKSMRLPLMGPLYLSTILDKAGYQCRVYNENILGRNIKDDELDADVLCLTLLTSSAQRGYEIAANYKKMNPHGKVIIGGVHATFMPKEAINYADHVIVGEGEDVVLDIVSGRIKDDIIYCDKVEDIDKAPIPNYDLIEKKERLRIHPLITSRGCPFDCDFCSVTQMFGRKYRTNSISRCVEEFKTLSGKSVFVYDDNFTANPSRSHELMDRLIVEDLNVDWSAQVRVDVTKDPSLVRKMSNAGCSRVYIGFESVNPKTLENFNKRQTVQDIERSIRIFHEYGIKVHGMFIFGSDEDDKDVFKPTLEFCDRNRIDTVQYMALTPLPGTYTFERMKKQGRLLHQDWKYYDGAHVVFKPKKMSAYELQKGIMDTYNDFYSYIMASKDALEATVDLAANIVNNTRDRVKKIKFNSAVFKLVGKSIVKKWTKLNHKYFDYLKNIN